MNFERAEFEQRYAHLQRALERENLDALLVTHEANFNYFTGFLVQHSWVSFSRNLIALLPGEGDWTVDGSAPSWDTSSG